MDLLRIDSRESVTGSWNNGGIYFESWDSRVEERLYMRKLQVLLWEATHAEYKIIRDS